MKHLSSAILLFALTAGILCGGCEDSSVTPNGADASDMLKATVNGTDYQFDITSSFSEYDQATGHGEFGGTILGSPLRTLLASFQLDLDTAKLPLTLVDPSISLTYTVLAPGDTSFYDCGILTRNCRMTITSWSGDRVGGTFSATLVDMQDTTKKATITNGQFSALLKRK